MLRSIVALAFCAAAVSALSEEKQSKLDSLLGDSSNSELKQLLAAKNRATRAAPGELVFVRTNTEKETVFGLVEQIEELKGRFDAAVTSGSIANTITSTISDSINNNRELQKLVIAQAKLKAELTVQLDATKKAAADGVADFSAKMWATANGLTDGIVNQAQARAAIESDLDAKLADFQVEVDAKLATLSALPDVVAATVAEQLKPIDAHLGIISRIETTYLANPKVPVFRWNWWHTHQHSATSWFDGNNGRGYGGVKPGDWTDGNKRAWDMQTDIKYIARLFIQKGNAGEYGGSVCQDVYIMHSSTTARMCGVVFRIVNTKKNQNIGWNPEWMYSSFSGWSEDASVSLNGASTWRNHCDYSWCRSQINMNLKSNGQGTKINTIIFIAGSSGPHHMGHSNHERANIVQFNDNSLKLPDGLEYLDDLDTATGNWKD